MEKGSTLKNPENPGEIFLVEDPFKFSVEDYSCEPNINSSSISDSERVAPTHSRPEEDCVGPGLEGFFDFLNDKDEYEDGTSSLEPHSSTCDFGNKPSFGPGDFSYLGLWGKINNVFPSFSSNEESEARMISRMSQEEWERQLRKINYLDKLIDSDRKDYMCSLLKDSMPNIFRERMYLYFTRLLYFWEDKHLKERIPEILSENELFFNAVFSRDGSNAVVDMIIRVRNLDLASTVTRLLSSRFYDIMTHPIAWVVIPQCFLFFGNEPNAILYRQVMIRLQDLAKNEVGFRSLNECIDAVSEDQQMNLLDAIANISSALSNDPYGNNVVQHVIDFQNKHVTNKILNCLKGKFASLSQQMEGSHVVQKCIESSENAAAFVVQEILQNPNSLLDVASDRFGNYVIQKALEKTRGPRYRELHTRLFLALESCRPQLNQSGVGRHVLNKLLNDHYFQLKKFYLMHRKNPSQR